MPAHVVAESGKLAPRLGVVWDPMGDGVWPISGSYGIYTAAISNSIANLASPGGTERPCSGCTPDRRSIPT